MINNYFTLIKPQQKIKKQFLYFAFYFLVSCLGCWSILFLDGWPLNHEYLSFFERVEVFRIALRSGDFFPLITPFAANGYGSTFPFFYHRLYSTFVSWGSLFTGSTYLAVKISIPLLLTIGAIGTHQTAKELQLKQRYCVAASLLLIFANYTLTDWLVRGAMAEFTAAMLVPWLFWSCLKVIQGKKLAGVWLGIIMSLMFYAHSVIFYYSIFAYLLTFLISFLGILRFDRSTDKNKLDYQSLFSQLLVSGIIIVCLVGFYALAIILISNETNLSDMKNLHNPNNQFQLTIRYLIDNYFAWGKTWQGFSVEIGRGITIPFLLMSLLLSIALLTSQIKKEIVFERLRRYSLFLILGSLFFYLQLPHASWFYNSIPGAAYIQFPWRLLVFLTPISILLLCNSLDLVEQSKIKLPKSQISLFLLLAIVAHQVSFNISAQQIKYEIVTQKIISERLTKETLASSLIFAGEYLPKGMEHKDILATKSFIEAENCTIESADPPIALRERIHFNKISLTVNSNPACRIYFNQFTSSFIKVNPGNNGRVLTSEHKTIIVEPGTGIQKIEFARRNLLEAILAKLNLI